MLLSETFSKRFQELSEKGESLPITHGRYSKYYEGGVWRGWATSSQSLIKAVFGSDSPHYSNFTEVVRQCTGEDGEVNSLKSIFQSAKEDFDGGYVFNVDLTVSGEVFGDFIVLAKQALAEGHKDVAAVLASAALEDALKRYAVARGLDVDDKPMAEVINALKSQGLVSGAQKSLLGAMPRIRNSAMHADWVKISEPEVNSVIGFVEQFLLTNFSS